jgi:hypothetical protein
MPLQFFASFALLSEHSERAVQKSTAPSLVIPSASNEGSPRRLSPIPALLPLFFNLPVPKAGHQVIVDHAHGLHQGVADGGAHEGEASLL